MQRHSFIKSYRSAAALLTKHNTSISSFNFYIYGTTQSVCPQRHKKRLPVLSKKDEAVVQIVAKEEEGVSVCVQQSQLRME